MQGEGDRGRREDDGVGRSGGGADEAEVVLVERLGGIEVADLERDEVGAGDGQDIDGIDLETSLGYLLKEASSALRAAMEAVLRPRGRRSLAEASAAVRSVEPRMLSALGEDEREAAARVLRSMIRSLRETERRG